MGGNRNEINNTCRVAESEGGGWVTYLAIFRRAQSGLTYLAISPDQPPPRPFLQPAHSARIIFENCKKVVFSGKSARDARRENFGGILRGFSVKMLRKTGARSAPRKFLGCFLRSKQNPENPSTHLRSPVVQNRKGGG